MKNKPFEALKKIKKKQVRVCSRLKSLTESKKKKNSLTKIQRTELQFFSVRSNIAAFSIFLHPKIYPKVSVESVIRTPDPS